MRLAAEVRAVAVALLRSGATATATAAEAGISRNTAMRLAREHGIPLHVGRPAVTPEARKRRKAVALLRADIPACVVAQRVGASRYVVTRWAKQEGIPLYVGRPPGSGATAERNAEIRQAKRDGMTADDLAELHGLTRQRIYQICGGER